MHSRCVLRFRWSMSASYACHVFTGLLPAFFFWPCSCLPCVHRTYARTDFYGHAHACRAFTDLMPAQSSMVTRMPAVEVHACTDFYDHAHACHVFKELTPAPISMAMLTPAMCPQNLCPHRFLWSTSCLPCANRTYARTDFYGHAHACRGSPCLHRLLWSCSCMPAQVSMVTLMPSQLFMSAPAVEVHACTDIHVHAHALQTRYASINIYTYMHLQLACL